MNAGKQLNMFLDHFYTYSSSLPVDFRSVSCRLPVRILGPVCVLVMSFGLTTGTIGAAQSDDGIWRMMASRNSTNTRMLLSAAQRHT